MTTHQAFRTDVFAAMTDRLHRVWWHDDLTIGLQPIRSSSWIIPLELVRRTEVHQGATSRQRPYFLRLDTRWSHRLGTARFCCRQWGRDCQHGWRFPWNLIAERAQRETALLRQLSQTVAVRHRAVPRDVF